MKAMEKGWRDGSDDYEHLQLCKDTGSVLRTHEAKHHL